MPIALTVFQGRAGDHNDLAMPGAQSIGVHLARLLGLEATCIGTPEKSLNTGWRIELDHAMPALRDVQERFEEIFARGLRPLSATSRCAVSIATLPVVARHRKDACVVWFDSHADLNTPESSTTGYLGGLALSGPVGLWNSGFGSGLDLGNVVLVGQRDLDPFEVDLINSGKVRHIKPGPDLAAVLEGAIAGRPVYMHLDCDVLNPGIVPTDYVHPDGLSLDDLKGACAAMARSEVIGAEIAEFQNSWSPDGAPVSPAPLLDALAPIINSLRYGR